MVIADLPKKTRFGVLPKIIDLVLLRFNRRPLSLAHLKTLPVFSVIWATSDDIRLAGHWIKSCKSSAKRIYENLQSLRHCGKELMRIEKKIGPGDEPCGTPEVTGRNSDTSSLQTTACVRPDI